MIQMPHNPASRHEDKATREGFAALFGRLKGPYYLSDCARLAGFTDRSGRRVVLLQVRSASLWSTALAIDSDGNGYLRGTLNQSAGSTITDNGWNPSEL